MGLHPSITYQAGLKTLRQALERRDIKKIPTEDLLKMAEFVLNNNIFEFPSKAYQQKIRYSYRNEICSLLCLHLHR